VNCYQSASLSKYNSPESALSNLSNNNAARLNRGRELSEQFRGRFDIQTFSQILSDHANRDRDPLENPILEAWGYSICNHGTRRRSDYPPEKLPWGTVSAEIIEPLHGRFWYAFGWPCGSQPEFGDQILQDKTWGKFIPFQIAGNGKDEDAITMLTTADGNITPNGARHVAEP
jgi:hypothetical protein